MSSNLSKFLWGATGRHKPKVGKHWPVHCPKRVMTDDESGGPFPPHSRGTLKYQKAPAITCSLCALCCV